MMNSNLKRLEELTLKMNGDDIETMSMNDYQFDMEPCSQGVYCDFEDLFREIPKFVDESLSKNTPFEANYSRISPVGDITVHLQGNSIWDLATKKCVVGIEVSMASPKTHIEHDY